MPIDLERKAGLKIQPLEMGLTGMRRDRRIYRADVYARPVAKTATH